MSHLHLPAEHTEADLALAGALAGVLQSRDLYVTWTTARGEYAPPEVVAVLRPPAPPALVEVLTTVVQSVIGVWHALTGPRPRHAPPARQLPGAGRTSSSTGQAPSGQAPA